MAGGASSGLVGQDGLTKPFSGLGGGSEVGFKARFGGGSLGFYKV